MVPNMPRALFPPTFQSLFDSYPDAASKIKDAIYCERGRRYESCCWSTGNPRLIPTKECLACQIPSSDFLWENIIHNIEPKQYVEVIINTPDGLQEKKEMQWNRVVATLLKEIGRPAESTPELSAIFSLPLLAPDIQLRLPERINRTIITPDLAEEHTLNIGFANQLVNFHVDTGYAGLSALAGDCEKVWLLAPPRDPNIKLLGEDHTFPYLVANLTPLAVFRQTSTDVIFLPPGLIHATYTIKTGILYGNNFRTRENVFGATMGLVNIMRELSQGDNWAEQDRVIESWIFTMRDIAEYGTKDEKREALFAFRLDIIHDWRRKKAFQHWTEEIEKLAIECYPKARLQNKDRDRTGTGE